MTEMPFNTKNGHVLHDWGKQLLIVSRVDPASNTVTGSTSIPIKEIVTASVFEKDIIIIFTTPVGHLQPRMIGFESFEDCQLVAKELEEILGDKVIYHTGD